MKKTFDDLSDSVSRATTRKYSTSFSRGILALHSSIRSGIYAIYGYVRLADEIVDSFHDYDKAALLQRLKDQTKEALNEKISLNPVLNSFQAAVHKYNIETDLIDQFLKSMEMDLNSLQYNSELYKEYILGSAEVVGLMCLHVFVHGDKKLYNELKPYAMSLGSAFQKVNFLRDLKDDYHLLGRSYFPNIQPGVFNNKVKSEIEQEIEEEFKYVVKGIKKLPNSSKFGVYLAFRYYRSLFQKIKNTPAEKIMHQRVRIPNSQKYLLMLQSYVQYKMTML